MRYNALLLLTAGMLSLSGTAVAQTAGDAGMDTSRAQGEVPVAGEPAQPVTPATEMPEAVEDPAGEGEQEAGGAPQPEMVPAEELTPVQFVQTAVVGNTYEIESSRLALEKASDERIREFAQKMIDEHTVATDELAQAAQEDAVAVVSEYLDARMEAMLADLAAAEENSFDQKYLDMQRQVHEGSIVLFEAFSGREGALGEFASETLPRLQEHLKSLEELQDR